MPSDNNGGKHPDDGPPHTAPHSAPDTLHNQPIADPKAHFLAIPWCASILHDPSVLHTVTVDRRPLPSGESNFARLVMNTSGTVRACVTVFRRTTEASEPVSKSTALVSGGGPANGEDPKMPFLLVTALLDLGEDLCSYPGMLHGGLYAVLMDEVMGTAANFQAEHGAHTVQFHTRYREPVRLPQVVAVRGRVVKVEGRKMHVCGTIEKGNGDLFAEADGMWIKANNNVGRTQL